VGSTFVHRLTESTGAAPAEVVRAYLLTREVFDFVPLWQAIEALDNKVPDAVQAEMLIESGRTVVRGTTWFLRSPRLAEDMAATIALFRPAVEQVGAVFGSLLDPSARAAIEAEAGRHAAAGVPEAVAVRVAAYDTLFGALDITEIAQAAQRPVQAVAGVYFSLAARLGLGWLRERIHALAGESHWTMLAKGAMRDELAQLQRDIAAHALAASAAGQSSAEILDAWSARKAPALARTERMLAELRALPGADLAMLSVALRELRSLA
jgi:glutamate dehydrogenase